MCQTIFPLCKTLSDPLNALFFCIEKILAEISLNAKMNKTKISCAETLWKKIRSEAEEISKTEPVLKDLFDELILNSSCLFEALAKRLSRKLGAHALSMDVLKSIILEAYKANPNVQNQIVCDIMAIKDRDPACSAYLDPLMYFKGFQAICVYRVAHILWNSQRKDLAKYLQSLSSEVFAVDIHPAARFGSGILLDHATSFVAGETSVVEDNVSILHEVTLGGTGNEQGDRHPKVHSGVLIGAGAKLIGNISIGKGAKIGAGSVVLEDVEEHTTVAGVPAKKVGDAPEESPSLNMNQSLDCKCKLD